jgi:hypothetical protein
VSSFGRRSSHPAVTDPHKCAEHASAARVPAVQASLQNGDRTANALEDARRRPAPPLSVLNVRHRPLDQDVAGEPHADAQPGAALSVYALWLRVRLQDDHRAQAPRANSAPHAADALRGVRKDD